MFITSKTQSTHKALLRMDRNNSKEINLARPIRFKTNTFPVIWYLKDHSSQTQTPYVF